MATTMMLHFGVLTFFFLLCYKPLLIQCRLFYNGCAVKGTLLLNKTLPPHTILIRPSMLKVESDPDLFDIPCANSLEIVTTSNEPKKSFLSRNLILLLHYGGVPKEYFLGILREALDDARSSRLNKKSAIRVASRHGIIGGDLVIKMIMSGIPLDEPYLERRLSFLMKEEKKGLRAGKLPVSESFYLMGTTDPTKTLKSNEVCVVLENGQISGDVLVYRNPGLHFGDIHKFKATYIEALEKFVGNSKYAIFFPVQGSRSIADEIAGGDYEGDTYWVFRNPEVEVPFNLRPEKFPHYMQKTNNPSYNSTSVIGLIFDEVQFQDDDLHSRSVWKLPCFRAEISSCLEMWKKRYADYRVEMRDALSSDSEFKDTAAEKVLERYYMEQLNLKRAPGKKKRFLKRHSLFITSFMIMQQM